jgi:hypothetical protein
MSKYVNASDLRKPDWLWATLKKNPEGLLFLAAGCALLLRRGRSKERAEQARSDAQEYLGQRESIPYDIPHHNRVGEWAKQASRIAENARDGAASLSKKMSETAGDYAGAASEYARDTREKVVDQSRRLAEKGQAGFQTLMQEQPLAVALVGLVAGAAVAAALPMTIPERRVLGPARQRVYEAAETAGQKITEAAGERLSGVIKEGMKEVVREVGAGIGSGERNEPEQATSSTTAPTQDQDRDSRQG